MQLKTILNRIEPFKSFVYTRIKMIDDGDRPQIEVTIEPRANGRPICSGCGRAATRLRSATAATAVRLRAAVGHGRVVSLRDAAGELPNLRRQGGASSLGRRQVSSDDELPLVLGSLDPAAVLEGSGRRVSHDLGERVSVR